MNNISDKNHIKLINILILMFPLFIMLSPLKLSAKVKESKRIAILNFSASNVSKAKANAVREIFEISMFKARAFEILEREQIDLIEKEQKRQTQKQGSTDYAVKVGKLLSVDYIVIGSLLKLGKYSVTVKFIDTKKAKILYADFEDADTEDNLRKSIEVLASRITQKVLKAESGMKSNLTAASKKKKHEKSTRYVEFSMGSCDSILDQSNGKLFDPEDIYGPDYNTDLGVCVGFGIGKILNPYFHIGAEVKAALILMEKKNNETTTESVDTVNFFLTTHYFPFRKGLYFKMGLGWSILAWKYETESNNHAYEGTAALAGFGYKFQLNKTFSLGVNFEYLYNHYEANQELIKIKRSHTFNTFVSFYWSY